MRSLAQLRNSISLRLWSNSDLWLGWMMALISTLAFSIATPIARGSITGGINPTMLLVARLLISTLLLGGSIALITPGYLFINRRGLLVCVTAGLVNGCGMLTYFWALTWIDASIASMMFSLSPLAVLGLLALRGERFTRRHFIRLGLALGGIYLLIGLETGPAGPIAWPGIGLVFITILCFAVHLSLVQWFLQGYDARPVTLYTVTTMTLVSICFWLGQGMPWQAPGWSGWLAIGALALVSTYLARLCLFVGVQKLGGGQIALLAPFETLLTVFWSVLFLDERLAFWQWLGGGLILISALLAVKRLNRARWRPRWRLWSRP